MEKMVLDNSIHPLIYVFLQLCRDDRIDKHRRYCNKLELALGTRARRIELFIKSLRKGWSW